jgi:prepilin-type N-terminal cleavage/methylation domain-containing protein
MRKLKAFTLVELLVVVAIIAVLATVIVVGFSGQKQKAMNATVKSNISTAASAAAVCLGDAGALNAPNNNGTTDICTTNIVTAKWPELADSDPTWSYLGWLSTAVPANVVPALPAATACTLSATQLCALGGGPGPGLATVANATKAAVCPLGGACTFYGI